MFLIRALIGFRKECATDYLYNKFIIVFLLKNALYMWLLFDKQ